MSDPATGITSIKSWKTERDDVILSAREETSSFGPLIDPDASVFTAGTLKSDDMVAEIQRYCRRTGKKVPQGVGEVTRCILESLAAKVAYVLDDLQVAAGTESQQLNVGGGGARNEYFLQMVGGATNLPIVAGPVEAASVGNLLGQMKIQARSTISPRDASSSAGQ